MKKFVVFLLGAVLLTACKEEEVPAEEHPFSPQEEVKRHLDDSFSVFVEALDPFSITLVSVPGLIRDGSDVQVVLDGIGVRYVYTFRKDGLELISASFRPGLTHWEVSFLLYGGLQIQGTVHPVTGFDWDALDEAMDLDVLDQGNKVAKLGIGMYSYDEAGEHHASPILLFRFPDGTSYAVTTLILLPSLVDYLVENVFSLE